MATVWRLLLFIVFLFHVPISATAKPTHGLSQTREAQKSYTFYINKHLNILRTPRDLGVENFNRSKSVYESAQALAEVNYQSVQNWKSEEELNTAFKKMRDSRFLDDVNHDNFKRRSSWLFPDDGCFARAELAVINLIEWQHSPPNKIFVFGNLRALTDNSPSGEVDWWYHVAPIVRVGETSFVLDPAIESKYPLEVNEWLRKMGVAASPYDFDGFKIAICSSHSYDPAAKCNFDKSDSGSNEYSSGKNNSTEALEDQIEFLDREWRRQDELGRNPIQVLGDAPPWSLSGHNL